MDQKKIEQFKKLANELHTLQTALEKLRLTYLYEVYETNADLIEGKLIYQGFHRDIAETAMAHAWRKSGYDRDYMLYCRTTQSIEMTMLSDRSKRLRNED